MSNDVRTASLARRTARGGEEAISAAQARASARSDSAGTTLLTSPHLRASSAVIILPVRTISIAFAFPTARVRRCVPPAPGITPIVISGWPNRAVSEAMIMSHAMASSHPPPRANPPTAAMTGFETFLILSHRANWSRASISVAVASAISRMSAPAANALSFPVMIMHFTASSPSDSSSAATRSVMS